MGALPSLKGHLDWFGRHRDGHPRAVGSAGVPRDPGAASPARRVGDAKLPGPQPPYLDDPSVHLESKARLLESLAHGRLDEALFLLCPNPALTYIKSPRLGSWSRQLMAVLMKRLS